MRRKQVALDSLFLVASVLAGALAGGLLLGGCEAVAVGFVVEGVDGVLVLTPWFAAAAAGVGLVVAFLVSSFTIVRIRFVYQRRRRWWIAAGVGTAGGALAAMGHASYAALALAVLAGSVGLTSALVAEALAAVRADRSDWNDTSSFAARLLSHALRAIVVAAAVFASLRALVGTLPWSP